MRKNSGFTVLELIIVIAILGVISAIAVPNFLSYIPNARLKRAARELYVNLQLTKITAIKENRDCSIAYSDTGYTIASSGGTFSKSISLSDYGGGLQFNGPESGQTFPDYDITFNARGTCNAGYAFLTNGTQFYRVGPAGTGGVVALRKWDGSTWK